VDLDDGSSEDLKGLKPPAENMDLFLDWKENDFDFSFNGIFLNIDYFF